MDGCIKFAVIHNRITWYSEGLQFNQILIDSLQIHHGGEQRPNIYEAVYMHQHVLFSLIIPSGQTKVLFTYHTVVLWICNGTKNSKGDVKLEETPKGIPDRVMIIIHILLPVCHCWGNLTRRHCQVIVRDCIVGNTYQPATVNNATWWNCCRQAEIFDLQSFIEYRQMLLNVKLTCRQSVSNNINL